MTLVVSKARFLLAGHVIQTSTEEIHLIKVWGRASSSNVQCVMWCAAELGLEVERVDAGLMYGVNDTPDYLAMNPNGTVPTLVDGDGPPLWESGAILRYLANAYAEHPFWPSDLVERANVDRWAEWSKVSVQMAFSKPIFWKVIRTVSEQRDAAQISNSVKVFESKLQIAEQRLSKNRYLAGSSFTLADIQFGHVLYRYYEIDIERAPLEQLRQYYKKLTELPHYRAHVMVNFDELRAE